MKKIISMALVLCLLLTVTVHCDTEPEPIKIENLVVTPTETKAEDESSQLCQELINTSDVVTPLKSLGVYKITAYCPCYQCCGKTNGITASGVKATAGRTVAVDKSIPFGTKLIINGHEYVAEDRGGSINGNKIDIFMESHAECLNFGVQYKEVFAG